MKVKIISLVAAASLFFASCTTSYNSTTDNAAYNVNVPAGIRSDFAIAYPDATNVVWNAYDANSVPIDWELTGWNTLDASDYAVNFNMGGTNYYGWYDSDGNLVGTAYLVSDYTKLPGAVNTLLQDRYGSYTIETVQREMWGSKTAYEIKLKGGDDSKLKLLVDSNGMVLKEKTKQ
jgi:hypothetical protein